MCHAGNAVNVQKPVFSEALITAIEYHLNEFFIATKKLATQGANEQQGELPALTELSLNSTAIAALLTLSTKTHIPANEVDDTKTKMSAVLQHLRKESEGFKEYSAPYEISWHLTRNFEIAIQALSP